MTREPTTAAGRSTPTEAAQRILSGGIIYDGDAIMVAKALLAAREPEAVARCGNCPHSPDMHSPVGTESCAVRDCSCPGLLTPPRSQEALRAALQRLLASADTVHRAGAPRGMWVDFWEAREQARAVLANQPAAEPEAVALREALEQIAAVENTMLRCVDHGGDRGQPGECGCGVALDSGEKAKAIARAVLASQPAAERLDDAKRLAMAMAMWSDPEASEAEHQRAAAFYEQAAKETLDIYARLAKPTEETDG